MKKLLHPLIPLFILLILGGKYVYDVFLIDKYDEKQLLLLEQTKTDGDNVSELFHSTAKRSVELAKRNFAESGNPPSRKYLLDKIEILDGIYQTYLEKINASISLYEIEKELTYSTNKEKEEFYNKHFSVENLKIQTLFQEYIQEIIKVDTLIAQKYQDYTFQNGESDEELAENYLQGKSIEILIHVAKIKAELAHIHSESTILLAEEYGYFIFTDRTLNSRVMPILSKTEEGNFFVSVVEIVPFIDSIRKDVVLEEYFQTNVKYHIDKKGFFVIDEENFDVDNLKLKWFPKISYNENYGRAYLEYEE
ncbi:hypothetical protein Fleli_1506 [Bernardetia litoralis DSM 6794]|uniref:Uncharacterized protein n=1 Tax=Bernardetia litoralis (strain ATCC 23117 / DSM 6794 / NBRC 15988 / NCIMB 1366 / Fx l1 / Sio-4) TaxID=880071 RepID=I4AIZ3_BERLS|nr:hypothetical protein [Bernardetia litoralis]AFM03928.1 hypothetical protein Fleli_1506 [Bernardetia litoralis DSM 6794]